MKKTREQLEANLQSDEAGKQDLVQQRTELAQKLEAAKAESQALQHHHP